MVYKRVKWMAERNIAVDAFVFVLLGMGRKAKNIEKINRPLCNFDYRVEITKWAVF